MAKTFGLTRPDVKNYKKRVQKFISKGGSMPRKLKPLEISGRQYKRYFLSSVVDDHPNMINTMTKNKFKQIYSLSRHGLPADVIRSIARDVVTYEMNNRLNKWKSNFKKILVD
jgi:ligand-binding SRPBCC domain-containing protein